ncbi:MAG TPA: GH1 family beta-glucosidase [Thermoanaerobaculia bacterium]|nr:GH1 family beta-glucosidase [Thermoanaerobaculia bacterium]
MTHDNLFPPDFLWGTATAAYQVEGSPLADGAGPSIWHRFSHTPGLVLNGDTGDVACDHYHRYEADIALMRELGVNAYRFSISWSRIFPDGKGRVNENGLDFYRRLVDGLRAAGIQPLITLFHWDLPAALDDRGGWLNRNIARWFADYAIVMFRALDDRQPMWATLNEPWVVTDGGYLHGPLAPGHRNWFEAPIAAHNLLRAHGAAVAAYRGVGKGQIGIVVNLEPKYPATESEEDRSAVVRADAYMNRQYLDPIFKGSYPKELASLYGEAWPSFPDSDFDDIRQRVDFVGVNYYTRGLTRHDEKKMIERADRVRNPRAVYTETSWEVFPQGLTDILLWVRERYGKLPVYITENGAAFYDPPTADGTVEDPLRVDYLRKHIRAAREAMQHGVDLRGYFVWSLLDNFEWALGYSKRFGIIHVDFQTQKRTLKRSAHFYKDVIRARGGGL